MESVKLNSGGRRSLDSGGVWVRGGGGGVDGWGMQQGSVGCSEAMRMESAKLNSGGLCGAVAGTCQVALVQWLGATVGWRPGERGRRIVGGYARTPPQACRRALVNRHTAGVRHSGGVRLPSTFEAPLGSLAGLGCTFCNDLSLCSYTMLTSLRA